MQGILFEISCFQINQLKREEEEEKEIKKQEKNPEKDEHYKENGLVKNTLSLV